MIVGLLERFSGYTYTTLMAESSELLALVTLADMTRPKEAMSG